VDIKFAVDARVLMFMPEKIPDREELLQMAGRGNRSSGCYSGSFFTLKDPAFEHSIDVKIKEDSTLNFK